MGNRIIVVGDDSNLTETISDILNLEGYSVEAVTSGEDAISLFNEKEFDVAVLDIKLPGISGIEVLQKIKETHPNTEVIILTGKASLESAIEAVNAGAFFFLKKPIEIEEFKVIVRRAIETRKTRLQKEELLRFNTSIIENMQEGMVIEKPDTTIVYSNPAMSSLVEMEKDALKGKKWCDFIDVAERIRVENEVLINRSKTLFFKVTLVSTSGKKRNVFINSHPFDDTENFITTFLDITELHMAQQMKDEYLKKMETVFSLGFSREKEILKLKNTIARLLTEKKFLEEEIEKLRKKIHEID